VKDTSASNDPATSASERCTRLPEQNGQPDAIWRKEKPELEMHWMNGNRSVADLQPISLDSTCDSLGAEKRALSPQNMPTFSQTAFEG
jgi:hypothetical protein